MAWLHQRINVSGLLQPSQSVVLYIEYGDLLYIGNLGALKIRKNLDVIVNLGFQLGCLFGERQELQLTNLTFIKYFVMWVVFLA